MPYMSQKRLIEAETNRARYKRDLPGQTIQERGDCMSDVYNEGLYQKFFAIVGSPEEKKRISQTRAAQMLDYSPGVISAYKNKSYTGSIKVLEDKVSEFLKRDARRSTLVDVPTAETSVMEQVRTAITMAQDEPGIAVITGEAGCGKTTALRHYARESYSALFVEVDPSFSQVVLLHEIARVAGVEATGSTATVIERIITALQGRDAVLIVDEADYLSDASLELLRRVVHDKAQAGVVLVGLPRLEYKIMNLRNDHQQLQSRVGARLKLSKLKRGDAEKIISGVWTDLPKEVIDAFVKMANGSTRTLVKLMARTHQMMAINKKAVPDEDIISGASDLLMR